MTFELILDGAGGVLQRPVEQPGAPRDDEVLVRVGVVGICASDMALYTNTYKAPHKTPLCFGHEWSGAVEAVGPRVTRLSPGDRVTGECSLWCGDCDRCRRNRNLCRHIQKFGITVDGAARSFFVMREKHLHRGGSGVDMHALALSEPLAVSAEGVMAAVQAHGRGAPLHEQRILIIGCGVIGLGCLLVLRRLYDVAEATVHDIEPGRVERALAFGARRLSDRGLSAAAERGADYGQLYNGEGYDIILETTGAREAFGLAFRLLNPAGTLCMTGFLDQTQFSPKDLVLKGARLVGAIGGSRVFGKMPPWLADNGAEARSALVTHSFPASRAKEAFETALDRKNAMKVQLVF